MGLYKNENGILSPIAGRGNIDGVYKAQGILGAKNLFNFDTPTETSAGITFENNGGIITANGTSGSDAYPFIECRKTLPAGNYIVTGCPSGGGDVSDPDNYQIIVRLTNGGGQILGVDYGYGFTFTLDQSSVVNVRCMTSKDMTVTNLVFKPMIRLASDTDSTYQPYAMTNKELTEKVADTNLIEVSSFLDSNYVSSCGSFRYRVKNGICFVYINNIKFTNAAIDVTDLIILPEGILPKGLMPASSMLWNKTTTPLLLGIIRNNDGDAKATINGVTSSNVNLSWYAGSFSYPTV